MKTKLTLVFALLLANVFGVKSIAQNALDEKKSHNYADVVNNSIHVSNPGNAVDAGDLSNYALMQAPIGVLNSATLNLGFSNQGSGGQTVVVEFRNDGGILSLDVLGSISLTLFDDAGNQVARKNGFTTADVTAGEEPGTYKVHLQTSNSITNISSLKIKVNGLLALANSVRIYYASINEVCPAFVGDAVTAQHNVQDASDAVSSSRNDFAILQPPLLGGNAYLEIGFSQPVDGGKKVSFYLEPGTTLLNLSLLQNITIKVYDTDGNEVATKSDFVLADAKVLSSGHFILNIQTPKGSYQVGKTRITISGITGLLTTLKVYRAVAQVTCTSPLQENISTASESSKMELNVYPNPFSNFATLQIKTGANISSVITVTNKEGMIVETHTIKGPVNSLQLLQKANPGIYFINVISGTVNESRKVIKLN
ncbi:MAG: T9SS type A sorting domain-containing protein [Bacteroidota bacterium]